MLGDLYFRNLTVIWKLLNKISLNVRETLPLVVPFCKRVITGISMLRHCHATNWAPLSKILLCRAFTNILCHSLCLCDRKSAAVIFQWNWRFKARSRDNVKHLHRTVIKIYTHHVSCFSGYNLHLTSKQTDKIINFKQWIKNTRYIAK